MGSNPIARSKQSHFGVVFLIWIKKVVGFPIGISAALLRIPSPALNNPISGLFFFIGSGRLCTPIARSKQSHFGVVFFIGSGRLPTPIALLV